MKSKLLFGYQTPLIKNLSSYNPFTSSNKLYILNFHMQWQLTKRLHSAQHGRRHMYTISVNNENWKASLYLQIWTIINHRQIWFCGDKASLITVPQLVIFSLTLRQLALTWSIYSDFDALTDHLLSLYGSIHKTSTNKTWYYL